MKTSWIMLFALALSAPAVGSDFSAKPASNTTLKAQADRGKSLPTQDRRDEDFATRGFVATRSDPVIKSANGKEIVNLDAYAWVHGTAPPTVNPSLWRHMSILRHHGLFKVTDGVWQVRGFDISNMTLIAGNTGWIIVDPLMTRETSAAALALADEQLGKRPVVAVIYSHSHVDHFGGVGGIVDRQAVQSGKAKIIAPRHFMKEASGENVLAGIAMARRGRYQVNLAIDPGPRGLLGGGVGSVLSTGQVTLIPPSDEVGSTGETRIIDGVELEFQMAPGAEAPAEMNIMLPRQRTLLVAELASCSLHNVLTPRGAAVRDSLKWASYLTEAISLYADRSDAVIGSHCWPHFGKEEVRRYLGLQRDNYKFIHDQTVRMMNLGLTPNEIAERMTPPAALADAWFTHGYYGTYSFNSKAVYQSYLGWYDGVPANLNPWPPEQRAARYVEAMGGPDRVLVIARNAMAAGDYRWASDILNQLVFAQPTNAEARALLADSYEQMGYQAESAVWRSIYLAGARELRGGTQAAVSIINPDVLAALPTSLLMDILATRIDPEMIGGKRLAFNFEIEDRSEVARVLIANGVMTTELGTRFDRPDAALRGPLHSFVDLLFLDKPLPELVHDGLKVTGTGSAIEYLQRSIEEPPPLFNISEP